MFSQERSKMYCYFDTQTPQVIVLKEHMQICVAYTHNTHTIQHGIFIALQCMMSGITIQSINSENNKTFSELLII